MHSEKAFPCPETGGESLTRADAEVPQSHVTFGAGFFFVVVFTWDSVVCSSKQPLNVTAL